MRFLKTYTLFLFALFAVSCIKYDMSYPRILAEFTEFTAEGAKSVTIDPATMTVFITLDEQSDLAQVKVQSVALNEKASFKGGDLPSVLDLRNPYKVTLSMYQDYIWTIKAEQPVERYVKCANQVGDASISVNRREVYVYISMSQRLKYLEIKDMKLDLVGSEVLSTTGYHVEDNVSVEKTLDCSFPMILDCTNARTFAVQTRTGVEEWKLIAIPVEVPAQISSVSPWTWSADVSATFDGTSEPPVIMYKQLDQTEWLSVPEENVTVDGIDYSVHIDGLEPLTQYEVKLIFLGEDLPGTTFMTCAPVQLPNFNFDQWWSPDNGALWYPYAQGADPTVWDSANAGTAGFGLGSSTVPETNDVVSGKAVRMTSKYAAVKFAAGNLFTGKFRSVVGTSGADLDWGVPFTSRPKALKGWYKYQPALVNYKGNAKVENPTEYDQGQLQVLLVETDSPYRVLPVKVDGKTTNGPTYKDQNTIIDLATHETVIARGLRNLTISDSDSDGNADWVEFVLPLEYRDTRTPTYVVVTAASSYLGDFFTGGDGSVLMIDELEFVYE